MLAAVIKNFCRNAVAFRWEMRLYRLEDEPEIKGEIIGVARYKESVVPGLWAKGIAAMTPWATGTSRTYVHINMLYVSGTKHSFYKQLACGQQSKID